MTMPMSIVKPQEFYDRTGRQHFGANYGSYPAQNDITFQTVTSLKPSGKVIELACGDARILSALLAEGIDIEGFDYSDTMLDIAKTEYKVPAERLHNLDLLKNPLPFPDNTADVAFCSRALSYLNDPMPLIREMLRVVKPNAPIIIDFFHDPKADMAVRREERNWGQTDQGEMLFTENYEFNAQKVIAAAREDFDIARVDLLYPKRVKDIKRGALKQLPQNYVFLTLHKGPKV